MSEGVKTDRESSTMSIADALTLCEVCETRGEKTSLQLFQINLEEAIWMCPNQMVRFTY